MNFKLLLFFAVIAVTFARPDRLSYDRPYGSESEEEEERSYEFKYSVEDESEELDFGHEEKKEDGRVEGSYYVLLPDTRWQKVQYYVEGDSGYVVDVSYSGEAKFSEEDEEDDHDDDDHDDDDHDDDRRYGRY